MSISPAGVFNLLVFASFFLAGVLVFFLTGVFPRMCSSATPLSAKPWGLRRSLFWKRCSTHQRHWQLQTNTQRQRQMQIIDKQNLKHYRQKQYFFQTQFCLGQVNCVQTNDKHNYEGGLWAWSSPVPQERLFKLFHADCDWQAILFA